MTIAPTVEYIPLASMSCINRVVRGHLQITVKAYCDGSGHNDRNSHFVTLAACIAAPDVWTDFEAHWAAILNKHGCPPLHMADARQGRGDFEGWRQRQVNSLVIDLLNQCFTEIVGSHRNDFTSATCTVNLADYRRAAERFPGVLSHTPEELCTHHVATTTLSMLPNDDASPINVAEGSGGVEIFFDRNEPFQHYIQKEWEKRKGNWYGDVVSRIMTIAPADYRNVIGLQAADFIAWHVNRYFNDPRDRWAQLVGITARPNVQRYWNYDSLIATQVNAS